MTFPKCAAEVTIDGSMLKNGDPDIAECRIYINGEYRKIGTGHHLRFRLDHFTGCRFGLFVMSERNAGGRAGFSDFKRCSSADVLYLI